MYTLQIFRTKSKDHQEAFSKMDRYVKLYNKNVGLPFPDELEKEIYDIISGFVHRDDNAVVLENYRKVTKNPFKGETNDDFLEYLWKHIEKVNGIYYSSLTQLIDELYELDFDNEAEILVWINDEIRYLFEDFYKEYYKGISVRIYGCISENDNLYSFQDMSLKEDEWNISRLKELFNQQIDAEEIDDNEYYEDWNSTGLYNLDYELNEKNDTLDKKTFFVVTYVKEDETHPLKDLSHKDGVDAITESLIDQFLDEYAPNIAAKKNNSALKNMEAGNLDEALNDILESLSNLSESWNNDTAAMVYFLKKDYNNALKYANESIKLDETISEHYYNRAQIFIEKGKKDRAIIDLKKAIDLDGYEPAKSLLNDIS